MTNDVANVLSASFSESALLNARRYGLTEKNLAQFTDIINGVKDAKPDAADEASPDVSQTSAKDFIKNYIKQRMTNRMSASLSNGALYGYGTSSQDALSSPQDMMLNMINMMGPQQTGATQNKSGDLTGLLNMNFDFATLRMLS
jgi:hypothetical protein